MTIGTVPEVLDISHVGQSGVAAHRLHDFLVSLTSTLGTVTSPFSYKGDVSSAATFPALATIETGHLYHMTADATDTGVAGKTSTGQSFLAGDEIVWNGTNWTLIGQALTAPFQFKGNIAAANQFPPPAATVTTGVKDGWVYRVTTGCTDNGGASYTNTGQVFLTGDIIVWRTNAWYPLLAAPSTATPSTVAATASAGTSARPSNDDHVHSQMANILIDKGAITTNADFPAPTGNLRGDCYRIVADVIDNGGAGKTNTGQVFTAGDFIMWDGSSAWKILNKTYTMVEQGAISAPTHFPLIAFVKRGYVYRVTGATNDTGGATYTNTGLSFKEGDVIVWNGSTWTTLGNKVDFQVTATTPVVLASNDSINVVDTTTLGAPSAVALPAATAGMAGRSITVMDGSGDAAAHNIVITPNGAETINGVNSPYTISKNWGFVVLRCIVAGDWVVEASNANVVAGTSDGLMTSAQATTLAAITDDHVYMSVTGLDMKTDEHEHSGVLNGSAGKLFLATHLLIKSTVNVGAVNSDGTINVGTAADGAQLAAAVALTGVAAVGTARMVPLAAHGVVVAGNATLYVNVESAETGAGTLEIDVFVVGRQI